MTKPKDFLPNSQPIQSVCGIYMIYCIPNERAYIGSSINVRERVATHKNDLSKDQHHCIHLQGAFNKYGKENFQYVLLEIVNDTAKEVLVSYENKYLLQIERDFIFNIQVPAKLSYQTPKGTNTGRIWTEEQKEIQRQRAKAQGVAHLFTPEVRARTMARCIESNKTIQRATKEDHHHSKVTLEVALAVKSEYDSLVVPGQIGRGILTHLEEKYQLGRSLIENICYGRHWSNPKYNSKDKANFSARAEVSCFEEVTIEQCELNIEKFLPEKAMEENVFQD
jgi:group I intron endonuclease